MIYMHCSIRVSDFATWQAKMYSDRDLQLKAGLNLKHLWRALDDPNRAFILLEVHDKEKARQHLNPANVKKSSDVAGLLEFQWCFVESISVPSA